MRERKRKKEQEQFPYLSCPSSQQREQSTAEKRIKGAQARLRRFEAVAKAAKDQEMADLLGVDVNLATKKEVKRRAVLERRRWEYERAAMERQAQAANPTPPDPTGDVEMNEEELLNGTAPV